MIKIIKLPMFTNPDRAAKIERLVLKKYKNNKVVVNSYSEELKIYL